MKLIGVSGFKESGKDSVYRTMVRVSDSPVHRRAFADKLKAIAAKALGLEGSQEELVAMMDAMKENGRINASFITNNGETTRVLTGRQYLQNFGQRARDVFGDTFWIDQILPKPVMAAFDYHPLDSAPRLRSMYPNFEKDALLTITDVRYPNEAERVLDLGGEVWEVTRPGVESDGHVSEIPLPPEMVDYCIVNDGDFSSLAEKVTLGLRAYNGIN